MIVAAVPLKLLRNAKSRLQSVLSPSERAALAVRMASHTVQALETSGAFDRIALVTDEQAVAVQLGVDSIPDGRSLNDALAGAAAWADALGAGTLLIAVADLPNIRPDHVDMLLRARPEGAGVVLSRTRDGGTAALVLSPPGIIAPAFGDFSGTKHAFEARRAQVPLREVFDADLADDLDTAADLERFKDVVYGATPPCAPA